MRRQKMVKVNFFVSELFQSFLSFYNIDINA